MHLSIHRPHTGADEEKGATALPFIRKRPGALPAEDVSHQKNLERPSDEEVYRQGATNARQEPARGTTGLCLSGFGGGAHLVSRLLYAPGFIVAAGRESSLRAEEAAEEVTDAAEDSGLPFLRGGLGGGTGGTGCA